MAKKAQPEDDKDDGGEDDDDNDDDDEDDDDDEGDKDEDDEGDAGGGGMACKRDIERERAAGLAQPGYSDSGQRRERDREREG